MHLNELFASPREQQQPNQPSEEDTHKNEEETGGEKEPENDQDPDEDEDDDDDDDDDDTNTNTNTNNNEEVMSNQMSPISQNSPISGNGYAPSPYTALNVIANERSLISMDKLEQLVKQKVHSRKFREYVLCVFKLLICTTQK
jgi:microfibrillar-associated protein 1